MAKSQCILDKFAPKNMSRESKTFNVQHLRAIADVGSCSLVPCQAMQMHQQHTAQLEMLRAAKLAEAINQKAPRGTELFLFPAGNRYDKMMRRLGIRRHMNFDEALHVALFCNV